MSASPELAEVLRAALDSRLGTLHVALPGRVESYDAAKRRADVQPLVRQGYVDEAGARVVERLPVIADVPVVFPGSGGVRVTWPVNRGDTVLLIFCSASIDKWLAVGGDVDPLDDRRHTLSDAVAIPGLMDFASVGDATPQIEFTTAEIRAGGSAALATKADIDALIMTFNTHVHAGVLPGGSSTAIPSSPAIPSTGTQVLKGS